MPVGTKPADELERGLGEALGVGDLLRQKVGALPGLPVSDDEISNHRRTRCDGNEWQGAFHISHAGLDARPKTLLNTGIAAVEDRLAIHAWLPQFKLSTS